jgi:hypothetical protein
MFAPRMMLAQAILRLENSVRALEERTRKGKELILKKISSKPSFSLKQVVSNFLDFFAIEPVSLDPFGIIKKFEHLLNYYEQKLRYFVKRIAPNFKEEERINIVAALSATISLNQLAKIMRHYLELVKKTRNLQLALLAQMQVPLIDRISKALLYGTESFVKGLPVGDSIGPLIASKLIGNSKYKVDKENEVVICEKKLEGKRVIIMKALGPGARLAKLGKAVEKLAKKKKIKRIITIDAAGKLEGEKTGNIAEGVGVAMGGIGVDKAYIENVAVENDIPLDSIVIKMSVEEAIQPMNKKIYAATEKVVEKVKELVRTSEVEPILIIGVGNSVGIGNCEKEIDEENFRNGFEILKRKEEEEQKKKKWYSSLFEGF